jgi:hypothetical protein
VLPVRTPAQVSGLAQRQAEYDGAKTVLITHSEAWSSQELRWQETRNEVNLALQSGDSRRLEAADYASQAAAFELQRLQILVDNARRDVETKRRALQGAIDLEISAIMSQRTRATAAERAALDFRLASLDTQLEQVQADAASVVSLTLEYLPASDLDPRMGPVRAAVLVTFLGEKTKEITTEIARVDGDLDRLLRTQERLRTAGDRASNRTRFGDDQPVGAARPPNAAGSGAAPAGPTLQQRIDALKAHKTSLQDMLRQLDSRVSSIRRAYPPTGGGH